MKTLLYLPTLIWNMIRPHLMPRQHFIETYKPSTEFERDLEADARNKARRIQYYAKRMVK